MQLFLSAVILVFLGAALPHQGECSTVRQRTAVLERVMRSRGNIHIRPDGEGGDGSPVMVNVSFSLLRLSHLEVQYGRMLMVGYIMLYWKDPRLAFSSDNVTALRIPVDDIWTPDIELYNTDSKVQVLNQQPLAVVYNSGEVNLVWHVALHAMCGTVPSTPDLQTSCRLTFGSWTYNGHQIDLGVPSHMDLGEYVASPHWVITSPPTAERRAQFYSCCPEPYVSAVFDINLKRST